MGGVGKFLFGAPAESKQKSESGNHAWPAVSGAMTPAMGYTTQGGNLVASLLGVGGAPAQTEALENFANSGGMQFLKDQGMDMVTSSKAAKGLLNSGSYGTALMKYGQGLGSTYLNQYLGHALDLSRIGLGAAGAMTGAGGWSKGSGNSTPEKKGIVPSIVGSIAAGG
jgi:hypothetical protein